MSDWTVLLGGTLIDGTGREPVRDAVVVVEGERIRYAGPRASAEWPESVHTYSTEGLTLMPGLIDCHDHLAHTGLDMARRAAMPPSLIVYETVQSLEQTLRAGITSVRDAGWLDLGAKLAVERGIVPGPRLVISVNLLCPTAGHGDPCYPSGMTVPNPPGVPDGVCNGVDECRYAVRRMVTAGADQIKIATTGGVSSMRPGPTGRQFTDDEVAALVDEAHAWGKPVLSHAYGGAGARAAIQAGVDSIEHGAYLHRDDDLLREMADRGTFLVPTLSVNEAHRVRGNPMQQQRAEAVAKEYRRTLERAFALGVRVAMGTDAGAYGHGQNAKEVGLLAEAGLTPMQAIVASTSTAASCAGLDTDTGELVPGKYADLLAVRGNPLMAPKLLEDAANLHLVLKGGVPCSSGTS